MFRRVPPKIFDHPRWGRWDRFPARRFQQHVASRVLPEALSEGFAVGEQSRAANGEVRDGYRGTWDKSGFKGRKRPELGAISTGLGRRFPRHDASLQVQKRTGKFKGSGASEEGWTEVRRRISGRIHEANGGIWRQQGQVVMRDRERPTTGGRRQRVICFKCLGSGHYKHECRDPVVCRHCRRVGHYEVACPVAAKARKGEGMRYEGMEKYLPRMACLVGEFMAGVVDEEDVVKAVVTRFPDLEGSKVKKLETGEILLRQISSKVCIELCGGYQLIGDAKIKWQRIIWTDKAGEDMTRPAIIDIRGIPVTYRSRKNMEAIVRPFGRLKGVVATGLASGDPNLTVLEVEMEKEGVISRPVMLQSSKGFIAVNISERQPPAPPARVDFGCNMERIEAGRDEQRKGEEALAEDGGLSGEIMVTGLGADSQRERRSEKEESSKGSVDPEGSGEVSKTISSCGTQGGGGRRSSSKHVRTRGKRLLKGDIIGRYVRYERRKLFLKGDGGVKVWLAVGNGGRMRVPAGWKMVRVGAE